MSGGLQIAVSRATFLNEQGEKMDGLSGRDNRNPLPDQAPATSWRGPYLLARRVVPLCALVAVFIAAPAVVLAETIGVFFDPNVEQIKFAAGDVKAALEKHKFTVRMLPVNSLKASYADKKIVIALASNAAATAVLALQGGGKAAKPGEQAFALRTTETPQKSYWALGGDANGAMYGGLQLAENIAFNKFTDTYDTDESPAILKRGIKLNLPLDKESRTYGRSKVSGANNAIHNAWDMSFWKTWFDEMARNRYNVLSIWSNHPFTSMIKMPEYPDVAIRDVTDFDGKKRAMSIDAKIEFWRKVMAYAKSRAFDFYLVNWNIWTDGASGKHGITDDKKEAATSKATIAYMRKCMTRLLETYPDLDGFGVTQGEHMSENDKDNSGFLANTFGLGMADYARRNPKRKLVFIHRWHMADFTEIKENFSELMKLSNVRFELSFKYSLAHMYSAALPQRMRDTHVEALRDNKLRSWLTVRNDDFYYHNWGDPGFARSYVNGMIDKGDWFIGYYMGSDGYSPTRTFFSKDSVTQGLLEVQRQWYMFMLWGRISYNPMIADAVFRNHMALRYPQVAADQLFTAWSKSSRGLPKVGDMITGTLGRDDQWWPEACQSDDGFLTVADFGNAKANKGSALSSIDESASGRFGDKKSTYAVADEIETDAVSALSIVNTMSAGPNAELGVTLGNIKAMSYLTVYYAYKIRGATRLKANDKEKAKNAVGTAYCWWMKYSNLMDSMYHGMTMARTANLADWHAHDKSVLKEFADLGGAGTPSCEKIATQ